MPIQLNRTIRYVAGAIVFLAALTVSMLAQERDRSKIPEHYKWDLTALYPADQAWRSQKENLVAELPKLREFQGKLASSAQQLADALETQSRLEKELKRLSVYAGLISDQDRGRPSESHGRVFRCSGRVSRDVRFLDELQCASVGFLRPRTQVQQYS
jgi:oligoendopeptidase F